MDTMPERTCGMRSWIAEAASTARSKRVAPSGSVRGQHRARRVHHEERLGVLPFGHRALRAEDRLRGREAQQHGNGGDAGDERRPGTTRRLLEAERVADLVSAPLAKPVDAEWQQRRNGEDRRQGRQEGEFH